MLQVLGRTEHLCETNKKQSAPCSRRGQGVSPGTCPAPGVSRRPAALRATVAGPASPTRAVSSSVRQHKLCSQHRFLQQITPHLTRQSTPVHTSSQIVTCYQLLEGAGCQVAEAGGYMSVEGLAQHQHSRSIVPRTQTEPLRVHPYAGHHLRRLRRQVRFHHQRAARLPEADGNIGVERLAQHQHGLEVAQVECDVAGRIRAVLVAQKHLVRVYRQLRLQRLLRLACSRAALAYSSIKSDVQAGWLSVMGRKNMLSHSALGCNEHQTSFLAFGLKGAT